jgi:GMP synthase (glutamine-hydrolysing)
VTHTDEGKRLIRNFLYDICGCTGDWTMDAYAETAVKQIQEVVGETGTVLLALSGGVDSSVAAALIYRAIGKRLTCVFVDHGLLRKGESEQVCHVFSHLFPVRFVRADASEKFFADLKGVTEPEEKRHIIGRDFIEVFREEAAKLGKLDYFAQGTIYPDVIESGQGTNAAVIKSHHNVGGLPKELGFTELIEPWASPASWSGGSPSLAPACLSASSAKSPPKRWRSCGKATPSSGRKLPKRAWNVR